MTEKARLTMAGFYLLLTADEYMLNQSLTVQTIKQREQQIMASLKEYQDAVKAAERLKEQLDLVAETTAIIVKLKEAGEMFEALSAHVDSATILKTAGMKDVLKVFGAGSTRATRASGQRTRFDLEKVLAVLGKKEMWIQDLSKAVGMGVQSLASNMNKSGKFLTRKADPNNPRSQLMVKVNPKAK